VLSWIPAFAGMTDIDVINDAICNNTEKGYHAAVEQRDRRVDFL
jgi:hypothetical protein